jgi:general secretion pathway protein D
MIVLIPHIVRQPDITPSNLKGIAVGNQTAIKLNYAPKPSDVVSGPKAAQQAAPQAATTQGTTPPASPAMPPATAPPAPTTPASTTPAADNQPALKPPATAPPLVPGMPAPPSAAADSNAAPAGNARVQFSPQQIETRMGGQLSVSLMLEDGQDISSAPLLIQYDPKVLKLNDVQRGDFLSSDGQQPVFSKNIMPDTGMAAVQLNRQPGTPGVNGAGILAVLTFQAVGRGSTTVTAPNLIVRNSKGQPVSSGSPRVAVSVQ